MKKLLQAALLSLAVLMLTAGRAVAAPISGAIYTTTVACDGINLNIYAAKDVVYLDGGPAHDGAAGLPPGDYYVQVTTPDGVVLGQSTTATVTVNDAGEFASCYQLSSIVMSASSNFEELGYDDSTNAAGEYKVWVGLSRDFLNDETKTDNFKVGPSVEPSPTPTPTPDPTPSPSPSPSPELNVVKYYDADADGEHDAAEVEIAGWEVTVSGSSLIYETPFSLILDPGTYIITESDPLETNWMHTTENPVTEVLDYGDDVTVEFGNLCVGAGGGHTKGYWSNKNGQATMNDGPDGYEPELLTLRDLNLRNESGTDFDPTTYAQYKTWLSKARAVNMAYMLSAQLSAMRLNVESGMVSGSALVYAPGVVSGDDYITVDELMTLANNALGANGYTVSDNPDRTYQAALKDAIDSANNNLNFVQAEPCPFTFAQILAI